MTNSCLARVQADTINLYRLVKRYPSTLLYPLLVLGVLMGVGVWGVTRVARSDIESSRNRASAIALEAASSYRQRLTLATSAIPSLVALVRHDPRYDFLADIFPTFVHDLAQQVPGDALRSIQLAPFGVVRLVYPLQGNQAAVGLDLFNATSERDMARRTVLSRSLTLAGPMVFRQGGYGVRVRMPIFVDVAGPNATFGGPDPLNPFCGDACYDSDTKTKFWGFATALVDLDRLTASGNTATSSFTLVAPAGSSSRSAPPASPPPAPPLGAARAPANSSAADRLFHGYRYRLVAPGVAPSLRVIAASREPPRDPVQATIDLPNTQWLLELSPTSGSWTPSWYIPLLVAVVVVALGVASMLFAALASRRQHQMLLEALLPRDVIREMVRRDTASMTPQIMQADTAADLLLKMMGCLLEGGRPELRDVLLMRTVVLRNLDIYAPLNLGNHIKEANLDDEVTRALMRQLGSPPDNDSLFDDVAEDALAQLRLGGVGVDAAAAAAAADGDGEEDGDADGDAADGATAPPQDFDTITGALALILTPQPAAWYDNSSVCRGGVSVGGGGGVDDAASDAALPTAGTECLITSPAPSLAAVSLGLGGISGIAAGTAMTQPASPASPAAAAIGSRQLSLNVPGHISSGSVAPGAAADTGGVFGRASRELSSASPSMVRCSASGMMLSLGTGGAGAGGSMGSAFAQPPSQRPATQPGCLPSAATVITAGGGAGTIAGANITLSTVIDDALGSGCLSDAASADPAVVPYGGGGGGGVVTGPSPLAPLNGGAIAGGGSGHGLLQPQGSGTLRMGIPAPPPRSPLGAQRLKRHNQPIQPTHGSSLLSAGQLHSGAGAGCGNSGHLCLSATFSGSMSVGQLALPEERPSSRLACGGGGGGGGGYQGLASGTGMMATLNARRLSQPPPPTVIEEVERLLAQADSWQFDTWKLRDASQGHPLSCLGFYLMQRAGLISRFKINPVTLARLLRHIEAGYPDNPYHSATHAADVLQTLHVIIHGAQLHVHYLDPLGLLAAYFAAIVHDYGHPGLTNDFLIATSDPLAVRYNDRSPLENHHAAAAFSTLRRPELDVTASLTTQERTAFRKQVIELVLATDMKQHFGVLSHFNTVHRLASFSHALPGGVQGATNGTATPLSHRSSRNLRIDLERPAASDLAPRPRDDTERLLGLQVAIKAADLGHLGEELEVHQRWLGVLEEEFFRQGDRERELGLPISPLFDRAKQGVSKSQVGFYDFVALPLVHALSSAFPGTQPLMRCFISNYNHWRTVDGQPPVQPPASRKQDSHLHLHPQQQHQQDKQDKQPPHDKQQQSAPPPPQPPVSQRQMPLANDRRAQPAPEAGQQQHQQQQHQQQQQSPQAAGGNTAVRHNGQQARTGPGAATVATPAVLAEDA